MHTDDRKDELLEAFGGTWRVDARRWRVVWSDTARLIHGWTLPVNPTVWQALDLVDARDRPQLFAKAVRCVQVGHAFEIEVGIRTPAGDAKRVEIVGYPADPADASSPLQGTIRVVHGSHARDGESTSVCELLAVVESWELLGHAIPHEMHSPLARIAGFARAISLGEPSLSPTARARLDRIVASSRHMQGLLDALLQFTPLSSCALQIEEVDLSALGSECIDLLRAGEPDRVVSTYVQPGMTVRGDRDLLRLVFSNLIGNAWKFTQGRADATITFAVEYRNGLTLFAVQDNGVGFEMSDAARLFVPFRRLHSREQFAGAGLGLAIVRRAVERHGGSVWARSAPGMGATFYVEL
jgi:hypothetical protein